MKTQRAIKCTAALIINLGARWRRLTSRPGRFSTGKELQYSVNMRYFWALEPVLTFGEEKNRLYLAGFEPRTVKLPLYPPPHGMRKEVKRRQNNELIHTECGKWRMTSSVGTVTGVREGRAGVRIPVRGQNFIFSETSRRFRGPILPHIQ
jgi:hypothetical protein